ncbi:MAG: glycoside hydrolase family 38 C-terminal domain-containing protein, partial [Romboutsia sp.]|uniref:glycoside hydrolase family 38 C-terminal domain-containing protein n=1 Tax=Romboutsia sp. TaxID=1965302 RepID=UPI003F3AD0CB
LVKDMEGLSWNTFALVEGNQEQSSFESMIKQDGRRLENEKVKVVIEDNGQLTITDKINNKIYDELLTFENVGDVGNEYVFKQAVNDKAILSSGFESKVDVLLDKEDYSKVLLTQEILIPVGVDENLTEECRAVYEFRQRKSERSKAKSVLTLKTEILLEKDSGQVKFKTFFDNQMKDHRLRVLFKTGINSNTHEAESIYEVVKRPNDVSDVWTNPTNPQHQHSFVNINDEKCGVTVSNYGINEYELLKENNTIALTLLRAVGEMGDWGYFDTPGAQCLGEQTLKYAIEFHGENDKLQTYKNSVNEQIPFSAYQTDIHSGNLDCKKTFINVEGDSFILTALKRKDYSDEIILRGYNATCVNSILNVNIDNHNIKLSNLIEEVEEQELSKNLKPAEIRTYIMKKQ